MSMLLVWITRESVLLGCDTDTRDERGEHFDTSKVQIVPHLNCVVAGRGSAGVVWSLADSIRDARTFDQALAWLAAVPGDPTRPGNAQVVYTELRRRAGDSAPQALLDPQELVVAGWSALEQRMVCVLLVRTAGNTFSDSLLGWREDESALAGWDPEDGATPSPRTADEMLEVARTITRTANRKMPGYPIGGRLITVEVTRDQLVMQSRAIVP